MATGDSSVQLVTPPITATSIKTALDAAIAATSGQCVISMSSFNDGRGFAVAAVESLP